MVTWIQLGPVAGAAFLGSLVECVEALTIVLAVGATRGWRPALLGALAGFAALAVLVALLGPVMAGIPIAGLQIAVGVLLLLFGMRWLRKAILRAAGTVALHDESAAYAAEAERLTRARGDSTRQLVIAGATSFKAVVIEGIEVAFIVIALSTRPAMVMPAVAGALAAAVLVALLGLAVHRPLAAVPENALKLSVGVLLSAFGVFWLGEGFGFAWPGADLSLLGMIGVLAVTALAMARMLRTANAQRSTGETI